MTFERPIATAGALLIAARGGLCLPPQPVPRRAPAALVYTPPEYESGTQKYPVLYGPNGCGQIDASTSIGLQSKVFAYIGALS